MLKAFRVMGTVDGRFRSAVVVAPTMAAAIAAAAGEVDHVSELGPVESVVASLEELRGPSGLELPRRVA